MPVIPVSTTAAAYSATRTLSHSRPPSSCPVPLSQPDTLRCPASYHAAPRAISHRQAPCAVRLATPSAALILKSFESRVEICFMSAERYGPSIKRAPYAVHG
eukprot:6213884-Pleurochrysis_carterae.AAC.1